MNGILLYFLVLASTCATNGSSTTRRYSLFMPPSPADTAILSQAGTEQSAPCRPSSPIPIPTKQEKTPSRTDTPVTPSSLSETFELSSSFVPTPSSGFSTQTSPNGSPSDFLAESFKVVSRAKQPVGTSCPNSCPDAQAVDAVRSEEVLRVLRLRFDIDVHITTKPAIERVLSYAKSKFYRPLFGKSLYQLALRLLQYTRLPEFKRAPRAPDGMRAVWNHFDWARVYPKLLEVNIILRKETPTDVALSTSANNLILELLSDALSSVMSRFEAAHGNAFHYEFHAASVAALCGSKNASTSRRRELQVLRRDSIAVFVMTQQGLNLARTLVSQLQATLARVSAECCRTTDMPNWNTKKRKNSSRETEKLAWQLREAKWLRDNLEVFFIKAHNRCSDWGLK
ncbi:MAG: hypothetical protein MHM6MM_000574 [Cercozoa sp. M6MM]